MNLINCTPHPLTLITGSAECDPVTRHWRVTTETGRVTLPPSGQVARVQQVNVPAGTVELHGLAIPCEAVEFGEIAGLPAPEADTIYIVSAVVHTAAKAAGRGDTACVTRTLFDADHKPIGAMALAR